MKPDTQIRQRWPSATIGKHLTYKGDSGGIQEFLALLNETADQDSLRYGVALAFSHFDN